MQRALPPAGQSARVTSTTPWLTYNDYVSGVTVEEIAMRAGLHESDDLRRQPRRPPRDYRLEGAPTMIPYIHLSIDTEVPGGAGYVRYSHEKAVLQEPMDEGLTVCVDLDRDGNVVGIEMTSLDDYAFGLAGDAAARFGLKVPVLDDVYA